MCVWDFHLKKLRNLLDSPAGDTVGLSHTTKEQQPSSQYIQLQSGSKMYPKHNYFSYICTLVLLKFHCNIKPLQRQWLMQVLQVQIYLKWIYSDKAWSKWKNVGTGGKKLYTYSKGSSSKLKTLYFHTYIEVQYQKVI